MVLLCSCTRHDAASALNSNLSSYSSLQAAVISPKCASCHSGSAPSGGINMADYTSLMASGTVSPGNPTQSSFLTAINNGSMPPGSPLSPDLIAAIQQWIQSGAQQDAPLVITSISPTSGTQGAQTPVTINGQGFQATTAAVFGQVPSTSTTYFSTNQVTAVSPASLPTGVYDVSVTNPDGTSTTLKGAFTVNSGVASSLSITKIFPNSGPGGTLIEIDGASFVAGSKVMIGNQPCQGIMVSAPTQISCTTPTQTQSGFADVTVINPDNTSFPYVMGFNYTVSASFTSLLVNTFQPKCFSCHSGSNMSGGLLLTTYANVTGTGAVIPRDPADSTLYTYLFYAQGTARGRKRADSTPDHAGRNRRGLQLDSQRSL